VKSLALVALGILFTGGLRAQSTAPPETSTVSDQLSPAEIILYSHARTLIDWTPRQIRACPFLHKLQSPGDQSQLGMILDRVGRASDALLNDFPEISCVEDVLTKSMRPQGCVDVYKSPYAMSTCGRIYGPWVFPNHNHKFRYIVIPRTKGGLPRFEEYRTHLDGSPLDITNLTGAYVITSDFATTWLYLTTPHQTESAFRYFGMQELRNRPCYVVGYAQNPKTIRSAGLMVIQGEPAVLLVQGLAWVDSETFELLRVTTWMLAPRPDFGLTSCSATVDFFPVQPRESPRTLWLPRDVTVRGIFRRVLFTNTHHYSDYKLFRVESTIEPDSPPAGSCH
jgi:hypothetical protein